MYELTCGKSTEGFYFKTLKYFFLLKLVTSKNRIKTFLGIEFAILSKGSSL